MAAAGCKKDPTTDNNTVGKHIEKVYMQNITVVNGDSTIVDRFLFEEWTWDGDELKTVKHYVNDSTLQSTATYTYTNGHITRIDVLSAQTGNLNRTDFTYDAAGKILSSVEYYKDTLTNQFTYNYDETGKMSGYVSTHHDYSNGGHIEETSNHDIEWTGNNITQIANHEADTAGSIYTYDNNHNPYLGIVESGRVFVWASENNVVTMDGQTNNYTYDSEGWPILRTFTVSYGIISSSTKMYYEYNR